MSLAFEGVIRANSGEAFRRLSSSSPEWMTNVCRLAHDDSNLLPDDWPCGVYPVAPRWRCSWPSDDPPLALPPLTEDLILSWVDLHQQRHGQWPKYDDGPIGDAPGETWGAVDSALRYGKRGLAGGGSLAKLLAAKRGVRERQRAPTQAERTTGTRGGNRAFMCKNEEMKNC
jgi:hypothetical protein